MKETLISVALLLAMCLAIAAALIGLSLVPGPLGSGPG